MGTVPTQSEILDAARPLVAAGLALHWLRRREKAPIEADWPTAPFHTIESLTAAYRQGSNIGIRLGEPSHTAAGYVHLIDIDIRDPNQAADAWAALLKLWPDAKSAPFVLSGSGGASEHRYFVTEKPLRSKKLAVSPGFELVFDPKKGREVKKRDWEIELFGTGKQAVLPPSIHPDTGNPYTWGLPIAADLLELGIGPILSAETVQSWGVSTDDLALDEDDDLFALVRAEPMGLSEAEIAAAVGGLPPEWVEDRDCWLQVGQALHHEYQGGAPGFERWCEWSRQSAKFDIQDQKRVWKSLRERSKNPVRMASLIKAAGDYRLAVAHADMEELLGGEAGTALAVIPAAPALADDLADLLGEVAQVKPKPRPGPVIDPEWKSYLHRNEEGVIKATLPNVQLIVRNDIRTRGIIAFNEFTQELVLLRAPGTLRLKKESPKPIRQLDGRLWAIGDPLNGDNWTDSHDHAVRAVIEAPERQGGYGLKSSVQDVRAAIDMVAHENAFHPVRDYLEAAVWDGTSRVEGLFVDYLGAENNAYHRAIARMTLVGAVTRIFEPGHKFDFVPILEGVQGKRKSTFIEILARSWFSELEGDLHDRKQLVEKMQGAWILEIPELQGFSKAEVTTIKGFVSARKDKVRMAYARRAMEYPRQCIFMGSTNDSEYLKDSTGGRRFWPVACSVGEIDTARLARHVDQLWAEAVTLYREMRRNCNSETLPLYLSDQEAGREAARLQESRRAESAEEGLAGEITAWLDKPIGADLGLDDLEGEEPRYRNQVCIRDVWVELMGREVSLLDQNKSQMLSRAMRHVPGWYYDGRRRTARWGQQRVFRREGVDVFDPD
jgi:predicted P-loop ATPase